MLYCFYQQHIDLHFCERHMACTHLRDDITVWSCLISNLIHIEWKLMLVIVICRVSEWCDRRILLQHIG